MCFQFHGMGNYASQCPLKKGKGKKQVVVGTTVGVEEDSFEYETTFSMVSCLCFNIL